MYENYWKLREKPFENTPDPKFLYTSAQHEEGLSRMLYVVKEGKGAGLLTGIFGCGKTILARALINSLESDVYKVAYITNPRLDDIDVLKMLAYYLGEENPSSNKSDCLISIEKILSNNIRDGKKTLVVIDEAHAITASSVFEEIRLLLNYQLENQFMLTLLLLGQPELQSKVDGNKQLAQRIAMRYHLIGLSEQDTKNYIWHRLRVAGCENNIFTDDTMSLIYQRSGGIPRRINQICDLSLLTGFGKQSNVIGKDIIEEAIESIQK